MTIFFFFFVTSCDFQNTKSWEYAAEPMPIVYWKLLVFVTYKTNVRMQWPEDPWLYSFKIIMVYYYRTWTKVILKYYTKVHAFKNTNASGYSRTYAPFPLLFFKKSKSVRTTENVCPLTLKTNTNNLFVSFSKPKSLRAPGNLCPFI